MDENRILHTETTSHKVLLELRRHLGRSFQVEQLDLPAFKARLTQSYQSGDGEALQAVEDMGAEWICPPWRMTSKMANC